MSVPRMLNHPDLGRRLRRLHDGGCGQDGLGHLLGEEVEQVVQ